MKRSNPASVPDETPLALVENGARGIRITALNACAARAGLHPGLSLADARAAVPALLSHPAEPLADEDALARLAHWLGRYGPARNTDGTDGIWIDVTGVAHLFGGEECLLDDLVTRLARCGITARAGLAGTLGAAHALARASIHPSRRPTSRTSSSPCICSSAWTIAPHGAIAAALAPLAVEALRLSPQSVLLLRRLGLKRIGDLAGVPRATLERRFSSKANGRALRQRPVNSGGGALIDGVLLRLDQAHGRAPEPCAALQEPPALSRRRAWSEPLMSCEVLSSQITALTGDLCTALREAGLGARRIALTLFRTDGTLARITIGLSRPSAEAAHILHLLDKKLDGIDAGFGIDVAVLDAIEAEASCAEQTTLAHPGHAHAIHAHTRHAAPDSRLANLIDRLANHLGETCLINLAPHDSHIPEHAQKRRPAHASLASLSSRSSKADEDNAPAHPAPRPPFLLPRPEPVSVVAEVPEGPPLRFTWRRAVHTVSKAQGPERIAPEWWRHLAAADASHPVRDRTRDYYVIEANGGARFWIFREGRYGAAGSEDAPRWFLHGLFG